MSVNIYIDPYFESNEPLSQDFGDSDLSIVIKNNDNIEIAANRKYFTVIVKDNDTSIRVWREHWWEDGTTPDNSNVDYFVENENHLYVVSMTLIDSSGQKNQLAINQSFGTYFVNNSFEWSNIENILSNNGYDTVEFTLDRSEEQQTILKLTISYDPQKITKLEYSFTGDPNSFTEYNAIDEQNINAGVIIDTYDYNYLYVRPTEAASENEIDQSCFNSLYNLENNGYDHNTQSWKFKLANNYTSVNLTITTTTRIMLYTFIYLDNSHNTNLQIINEDRSIILQDNDSIQVSVNYGTSTLNAKITNALIYGEHLTSVNIINNSQSYQQDFSTISETYEFTLRLPEYDDSDESINEITIRSNFSVNVHTLNTSVNPYAATSLVTLNIGDEMNKQLNTDLSVGTGTNVQIIANTDGNYNDFTISSTGVDLINDNNISSFEMPDNNVNISINYTSDDQGRTYGLTVVTNPTNIQNYANIKINGVNVSSGQYAKDTRIEITCEESFEYNDFIYTILNQDELSFTMPDHNKTVTIRYDSSPKTYTVNIITVPDNMQSTIPGFTVTGAGVYNTNALVSLSWNYNGSTDTFTYNKNEYEFISWEIGNSSDEHPSTNITVTEDIDIKLIFNKTAIVQEQTYYLGDSYQKHYRFKIQYKNAQTDPIILDWYPIVYDYGVNE